MVGIFKTIIDYIHSYVIPTFFAPSIPAPNTDTEPNAPNLSITQSKEETAPVPKSTNHFTNPLSKMVCDND